MVIPEPIAPTSRLTSIRSTPTPPSARPMAAAVPARPAPTTRTLLMADIAFLRWSLDGDRVDGGADRTGDRQRGGGQEELVDAVGRAVSRQFLQRPHLPDKQPHVRDGDLVQR